MFSKENSSLIFSYHQLRNLTFIYHFLSPMKQNLEKQMLVELYERDNT